MHILSPVADKCPSWTNQRGRITVEIISVSIFTKDMRQSWGLNMQPWSEVRLLYITKTYLYNFDPLKPHFYIVKLGFTVVYIIFLISAQNIDCGYSLEPPHWGSYNKYPQSIFWAEIWKISDFLSENFRFLMVKFLINLNRRVFVMECTDQTVKLWSEVRQPTDSTM